MQTIEEIRVSIRPELFRLAMTTPGYLNDKGMHEKGRRWRRKNSRIQLAWIGDRILFKIARPVLPQIEHNFVVSTKHLYNVGEKLGIFSYLQCGNGEKKQYWEQCRKENKINGHHLTPRRLIAESVEALIAAIYLDHGYLKASEFVKDVVIQPYLTARPA